jgi:hypothetical protein
VHPDELSFEERASLDRAMATVQEMTEVERLALIEHALAACVRFATKQDEDTLRSWASGLLRTVRVNSSKAYREAIASATEPARPLRGVSVSSLLAGIRR